MRGSAPGRHRRGWCHGMCARKKLSEKRKREGKSRAGSHQLSDPATRPRAPQERRSLRCAGCSAKLGVPRCESVGVEADIGRVAANDDEPRIPLRISAQGVGVVE
jgi:hypothetical protein